MDKDHVIDEINAYLDSYSPNVVRHALKHRNNHIRGERIAEGWKLWTEEGVPNPPMEWRKINGVMQYREPRPVPSPAKTPQRQNESVSRDSKICPDCRSLAYAQAVCPACAKGKAGIRKMYICGENDSHVFYTE